MESEVVYYLYTFEAKVDGKYKKFYFENKKDAALARFMLYKTFDYERLTINNFVVPVSHVERKMLRKEQIKDISYFSSYRDFENYICGRIAPENNPEKGQG